MNLRRRRCRAGWPLALLPGIASPGQRALHRLAWLVLVAGIGLIGCASLASTPTAPSAGSTSLATISVSPTARPPIRASGRDPWEDLVDGAGKHVTGPTSLDIIHVEADAFASEIRLQLGLLAAPPPSLSGLEKVSFVFVLDTDGDVGPEYSILFETRDDGSYAASLDDHLGAHRYEGSEFPGLVMFQERVIFVQLPLSSLGSPTSMKVCAVTRATGLNGNVTAEDNVPDGVCLNGEQMLTLR